MSAKRGLGESSGDEVEIKAKEPEPAANALWMFMFRFVLGSGLAEFDARFQDRKKQKPAQGEEKAWSHFLIEAKLHDPRLTMHIAAFADPRWTVPNQFEDIIVEKMEQLRDWEQTHLIAAPKGIRAMERFKQNPGETFLQLDEALGDQHQLMLLVEDQVRMAVRRCNNKRPRFNIWDWAIETLDVLVTDSPRWNPMFSGPDVVKSMSRGMLHADPWLDDRKVPGILRHGEPLLANEKFLVCRFQLWDAKLRFADELKKLSASAAKKQLEEHGMWSASATAKTRAKKTSHKPKVIVIDESSEEDASKTEDDSDI